MAKRTSASTQRWNWESDSGHQEGKASRPPRLYSLMVKFAVIIINLPINLVDIDLVIKDGGDELPEPAPVVLDLRDGLELAPGYLHVEQQPRERLLHVGDDLTGFARIDRFIYIGLTCCYRVTILDSGQ